MRLNSVRDLKLELASEVSRIGKGQRPELRRILSFSAAIKAFPLGVEATLTATTHSVPEGVAFGIVPADGRSQDRFQLAVRVQSVDEAAKAYAHYAAGRASGEAQLRYVGPVKALAASPYRKAHRPLAPGWSVGAVETGSIGFFALDTRNRPSLVSNNHVLTRRNPRGAVQIVQPGPLDKGRAPKDLVAYLERSIKLVAASANRVDAAYANIEPAIPIDATWAGGRMQGVVGVDELIDLRRVWKVGRTTGRTAGKVSAVEVDQISADYGGTLFRFDGQLEIEGLDGPFALPGDSGAAVLNAAHQGVGMIFSGSGDGAVSYANPLETVLRSLSLSPM